LFGGEFLLSVASPRSDFPAIRLNSATHMPHLMPSMPNEGEPARLEPPR